MKGGLTLDSRSGWQTGSEHAPVIVPGDVEKSLLIKALRYTDPDLKMPPKKALPSEEVAVLEEWVKRGAPDPREPVSSKTDTNWWSLRPIVKPAVLPGKHPIDHFLGD